MNGIFIPPQRKKIVVSVGGNINISGLEAPPINRSLSLLKTTALNEAREPKH